MRTYIDIICKKISLLLPITMYIKPGMTMHNPVQYVLFIDLNAQSMILNLFSVT